MQAKFKSSENLKAEKDRMETDKLRNLIIIGPSLLRPLSFVFIPAPSYF